MWSMIYWSYLYFPQKIRFHFSPLFIFLKKKKLIGIYNSFNITSTLIFNEKDGSKTKNKKNILIIMFYYYIILILQNNLS